MLLADYEIQALAEILGDPEVYPPLLMITDEDTETRREYEHPERQGRLATLAVLHDRLRGAIDGKSYKDGE